MAAIKKTFFILFFLVFLSELLMDYKPSFTFKALHGDFVSESKPELTFENWLNGNYQEHEMKYFEQNLFLRPFFIRLRNQLGYFFFDEINASGIREGKDHVLYETAYIESYMGKDFAGENEIIKKANMLAYVQQELKKRNIDLIFLIAPTKQSILPEYIPSEYDLSKKKRSNYDAFSEQLEKQKINNIDFTKYFLKLKPTGKYPLFTRYGTHWSGYASTIAADTLVKYMENLRNIDMVDFYAAGGEESEIPQDTDSDLGDMLNLMYDRPSHKMYYPNIVFKKNSKKVKPNVLIIGDSFVWSWIGFHNYFQNLFEDKSAFWYYNHEIGWSPIDQNKTLTANLNLKEQTSQRDFIIIENNDAVLGDAGYFFINQMFEMLQADELNKK